MARERQPLKRPHRFVLFLRRRRPLVRPALWATLGLGVFGTIAMGIAAFDPAGRAARLVEDPGGLGARLGLTIEQVELHGRRNTPIDLVRGALGIVPGDPMLGFSPHAAKERLETIAWVARAHVERRLPDTIMVRIEEREPFALWQNAGRFSVIDRNGNVVATTTLDQFGPLPLLVGPGADRAGVALVDALRPHPEVMARVQALVRVAERRWNLRLHSGTDILLPDGNEVAAIARLAELHRSHAILDRPLAAVDLRLADRMVLRPMATAAPAPIPVTQRGTPRG
ncbi:cell division protein FtsQ/DivIB [Humitalea sp. 24SJ18S-53]|uniref:cell division protein FtsQ/DivIB n=1 Tax=Humitalea sp. 24SJ18S-53 TaxID=3422307 RepID=UPI003D66B687